MPSSLTHAVAATAISATFYRPGVDKRVWGAGIVCSMLPDIDVLGFRFGVHYGDFWGHRGFSHSLAFAALLAAILTVVMWRTHAQISSLALFSYLVVATASHGLLDAMTNGGLGIAFFSPFDNQRYFLPWRPIRVSPIGVTRFLSYRGVAVLQAELLWVWLPSLAIAALAMISRRFTQRKHAVAG